MVAESPDITRLALLEAIYNVGNLQNYKLKVQKSILHKCFISEYVEDYCSLLNE